MKRTSKRRVSTPAPRCRPRLEALEPRWTPAGTVTWINPQDGDWDVAQNWSAGQVPTSQDDVFIGGGVTVTASGEFNAAGNLTCDGALVVESGVMFLGSSSTIASLSVNGGSFRASGGVEVTQSFLWTGGQLAGLGASLSGTALITGQGKKFLNNFVLNNNADLLWTGGEIAGDGGEFRNLPDGSVRVTGDGSLGAPFTNAGRLIVAVPEATSFSSIDTTGDVLLQSGQLAASSYVQTAGQTVIADASLFVQLVQLDGGVLTGNGVIEGSVENHGLVAPVGGTLLVLGGYVQAADGVLVLLVGPEIVPLAVESQATLAGTLDARPSPGVTPMAGEEYVGVLTSFREGTFDTVVTWSDDRSGLRLAVEYSDFVYLVVEEFTPVVPVVPPDAPTPPPDAPPPPPGAPAPSPPAAAPPPLPTPPSRTNATTTDESVLTAVNSVRVGPSAALPGTAAAGGGAAPGATPTPGSGRGVAQGPPQGPASGGGGRVDAGNRLVTPQPPQTPRGPTVGGPMGGRKSASERTESAGLADELFATFPLVLPEVELPSVNELLSTADVAAALVVGVRPRANLVPQQGGSHLSGVATLVASEDGGAHEADVSPFAGLFVSPLGNGATVPFAETLGEGDAPPGEEAPGVRGGAVVAVLLVGAAGRWAWGRRAVRALVTMAGTRSPRGPAARR